MFGDIEIYPLSNIDKVYIISPKDSQGSLSHSVKNTNKGTKAETEDKNKNTYKQKTCKNRKSLFNNTTTILIYRKTFRLT